MSDAGSIGQANMAVVTEFVEAWSRLDADELAGYFTEDVRYHNMPLAPIDGRDRVRDAIASFTGGWTSTTWELVNIAAAGDVVFTERLDRITTEEGGVDLPVAGVFELDGGKIRVWRDYFDLATFTSGLSPG